MYPQHTTWQLVKLADCGDPDKPDGYAWPYVEDEAERAAMSAAASPGARFLRRIEDDVREWLDDNPDATDRDAGDACYEIADNAVPIYTHEMWSTFLDLAAYQEDPSELNAEAGDMSRAAALCLYIIAERLASALMQEYAEDGEAE